jgi:hypothetical protein
MLSFARIFPHAYDDADLVKALQIINRALELEKYKQFLVIPNKLSVAKRVSQCLNPALPSGVHVKALEVLDGVFRRMIEAEAVARELHLWTPALFALFQHAANNVKPIVLKVYEQHLLPLGQQLVPCLSALMLGILVRHRIYLCFVTRARSLALKTAHPSTTLLCSNCSIACAK